MRHRYINLLMVCLMAIPICVYGQRYSISGSVTDKATGEDLIGATVYVQDLKTGTSTNQYGFYSLTLPKGHYRLACSFVGYKAFEQNVELAQDIHLNIQMMPTTSELQEVVVSAEGRNANVSRANMSVEHVSVATIKRIPALMGEVDVIKAIQLLPGVQAAAEGSSGFSVRGGSPDQNLILLDEATVYNASHLMGFFSVFNNDAIKDVTLYKGDIPATFGGRLSSLLDIRTRDGNNQHFTATGGIGTISSRLTVEGPLFSDKATYLLAGRRTYADVFLKLSSNEDLRKTTLYFYDLNGKLNYRINDKNRIFFAAYTGTDDFGMPVAGMKFGNQMLSFRWNHVFAPRLFSNFTVLASRYDYNLRADLNDVLGATWNSEMKDYGLKADMSWHPNPSNDVKFGYYFVYHVIAPGQGAGKEGGILDITGFNIPHQYALEHALFVNNETKIGDHLKLKYGLRYSLFQNLGNGEKTYILNNYAVSDSAVHRKGRVYHNEGRLEPRVSLAYSFNDIHSVKASYSRTVQYIQLASNSAAGSPLDVWFQTTPNVKPQICDQLAVGYFRNFFDNQIETSVELYYKDMKHVIDFRDHARLMANKDIEGELRFGKGNAYGLELMIRKPEGRLNGWISYTYAKARRRVDEINKNRWYRSPYDKPHNISVVLTYQLSDRWDISANWVYASGMPVTYPVGRYQIEGRYVPVFDARNASRYPAYHRLDLSANWKLRHRPGRRLKSELNFSLYNAYGRHNPWTIQFRQEEDNPNKTYAEMIYLFSFVPSITWNFTF